MNPQDIRAQPIASRTLYRRLRLGVALLNLIVFTMAAFWLYHSRQQDLEDQAATSRNLSVALEQGIFGTVRSIDLALLTVADTYSRRAAANSRIDPAALNALLAQQLARLPEVESLRIADARGEVKYGHGIPGNAPVVVTDRDYFLAARDSGEVALTISKPLFARISKKWVIVLARRITLADGAFGGVVYANLALDYLGASFANIDVGPHGAVTLRDGDLGIIARHPEPQGVGRVVGNTNVSREFRALIAAGHVAGGFTVHAGFDNVERIFSFRKIGSYPLYIIVGLAVDDVLAAWRWEAATTGGMVLLFALATMGLSWLIAAAWRRQETAAAALAREEAKFHMLADYTYDWEYWLAADGKEVRYMTPSCERITGYPREAFIATPGLLVDIVHPDDRPAVAEHLKNYNSDVDGTLDFRILRRDGEVRWISHACRPVHGPQRQFLGRRVGNRDITERKQIEEALKESEERLKTAQHIAQVGSWEHDLVTDTLRWSDEIFRILELDPKKSVASEEVFLAAIHPEDRERIDFAYAHAANSGQAYEMTHRLLLADGTLKYIHVHGDTIYDPAGKPLSAHGTVQDVTLRMLTEESLKESEERFRTIADYTYDWEYWQGPQGEFLYISPSCQRVTGYSQADFISNPKLIHDIIHPDDRHLMASHLDDMRHEDDGSLDFRILTKEGELRWIAHGCRAVFAKDGAFMGRRASNRDITDRKNAEEEIQRLAYFDTLTGLPNRRLLLDRLEKALSQAHRFQRSLAIMFLDLDNFKRINDALGHAIGDELLKEVARRLVTCIRGGDTVARQGGDEFIVVLTEIAQSSDATRVAEKILDALRTPVCLAGQPMNISTSIGIAIYPVDGTDDVQELLKKADQAMYAAKAGGRNGYRLFRV